MPLILSGITRIGLKGAIILLLGLAPASAGIASDDPPAAIRFSADFMDRSVSPDNDFYQFACGGWLKTNQIPAHRSSWAPWIVAQECVWYQLRDLLTANAEKKEERTAVQRQVGDFFASGMDIATRNRLGFSPIEGDVAKIEGLRSMDGLPVLLADFHSRGIGACFDAGVSPDQKQSTVYVFGISQADAGLGLPDRDYYFDPKFADERKGYRNHLEAMFKLCGDEPAAAARNAETVFHVETTLARFCRPREDLQDPLLNYQKLSRSELQELTPHFAWENYFKAIDAPDFAQLVVGQPEFLHGLDETLHAEPLEAWKIYLRWQVVRAAAPYLHEAAEQQRFAFYGKTLSGEQAISPLWRRVTIAVDGSVGDALGQLYVAKYFPPTMKARVDEMVNHVEEAFRERLLKVTWMSETTRTAAIGKLNRFVTKVGYPIKFRDYSPVEIRREDYLGNVQRAVTFEWRRGLARIGKTVDRNEWNCTPPTVNAYFTPTENSITFPAGILQPPMFDPEMDDAVNYGNIGATIGHEITHGYDSQGRKYDAEGNLYDWWTKMDAKEYVDRVKRVRDQFNALEALPGLFVNGKLTLAENIADLGGLVVAYDALEKALAAHPEKRREIDGLTPEQRFFVSYAQSWCTLERTESVRQRLTTDEHAPSRFRAYAPLLHMPQFYEAFKIREGAPMWLPPALRATIW